MKKEISVVVPVYMEEANIRPFLNRLEPVLENINAENNEIIFVLDPGTDKTEQIILEEINRNANIRMLVMSRKFGQPAATMAGIGACCGRACVLIDVDLQDPPELIKTMLDKIKEGHDVVYAARQTRKNDSWFKRKTAELFYWLMKKFGVSIIPHHADFRMITRRVLNAFLKFHENNLFIRATFPIVGFSSCVVYYDRPERLAGETKYHFLKMLEFAIDGLTSFSVVPLRICSVTGLFVSLIALIMLIWSLIANIFGLTVPGWTSTVVPLYFLGGVQLLFLGVVGEYIGKIYTEVKKRPRYIIQETKNID